MNTAANTITFQETTAVEEEKGITFFVRPGERLRSSLRLGPVGGSCKPSPASSCVLVPRTNCCPRAWTQRILN